MLLDKRIFDSVLSAASNGMCGMLTQSYRNNNEKKEQYQPATVIATKSKRKKNIFKEK